MLRAEEEYERARAEQAESSADPARHEAEARHPAGR
jgi:hypothetical protein